MEPPVEPPSGKSKRSQHFRSALTLVHKKSATKWSVEEFLACVGAWGEENPEKAAAMRVQLGQYLQTADQEKADEILSKFNAFGGIDALSDAIEAAKAEAAQRKPRPSSAKDGNTQTGRKDTWRPALAPRTAVHAMTVPLLETEKTRLEREIAEVERLSEEAMLRFREHRDKAIEAKLQAIEVLDRVDQAKEAYASLNMDEMSDWTMDRLTQGNN